MPPYWAPNSTGARLTNLFLILTSQFLITKIIPFALRGLSVGPDGAFIFFSYLSGGYAAGAAPRPGYVLSPSRALNFVRYRSEILLGEG